MPLHEPEVILDKLDLHSIRCHFPKICCFHRSFQYSRGMTMEEMPVDQHQCVTGTCQPRSCLGCCPSIQTVSMDMIPCMTLTGSVINQNTFPFKTLGYRDYFTLSYCKWQDAVLLTEQETDFKTQSLQRKQFKDANCEAGFLDKGSLLL